MKYYTSLAALTTAFFIGYTTLSQGGLRDVLETKDVKKICKYCFKAAGNPKLPEKTQEEYRTLGDFFKQIASSKKPVRSESFISQRDRSTLVHKLICTEENEERDGRLSTESASPHNEADYSELQLWEIKNFGIFVTQPPLNFGGDTLDQDSKRLLFRAWEVAKLDLEKNYHEATMLPIAVAIEENHRGLSNEPASVRRNRLVFACMEAFVQHGIFHKTPRFDEFEREIWIFRKSFGNLPTDAAYREMRSIGYTDEERDQMDSLKIRISSEVLNFGKDPKVTFLIRDCLKKALKLTDKDGLGKHHSAASLQEIGNYISNYLGLISFLLQIPNGTGKLIAGSEIAAKTPYVFQEFENGDEEFSEFLRRVWSVVSIIDRKSFEICAELAAAIETNYQEQTKPLEERKMRMAYAAIKAMFIKWETTQMKYDPDFNDLKVSLSSVEEKLKSAD